jgi:hypothetical protein
VTATGIRIASAHVAKLFAEAQVMGKLNKVSALLTKKTETNPHGRGILSSFYLFSI